MSRKQLEDFVGAVALVEYGEDGVDRREMRLVARRLWQKEFAKIGDGESSLKVRIGDGQSRYCGFRPLLKGRKLGLIDVDEVRKSIQSQTVPICSGNKVLISQSLREL